MEDVLGHTYNYLTLQEYYNASIAFRCTKKTVERKKRFEWAKGKARLPKYIDGYCADTLCGQRRAACIFLFGDVPKYVILSNYCSKHTDRDLLS